MCITKSLLNMKFTIQTLWRIRCVWQSCMPELCKITTSVRQILFRSRSSQRAAMDATCMLPLATLAPGGNGDGCPSQAVARCLHCLLKTAAEVLLPLPAIVEIIGAEWLPTFLRGYRHSKATHTIYKSIEPR